jgi:hypothetical protein
VTAVCEVVEALGGGRYRLRTVVRDSEETVVDGEAVVWIDPDSDDEAGEGTDESRR